MFGDQSTLTTRGDGYLLNSQARIIFQTDESASHFFGYYYPSPLKHGKLLCHRVTFDGRNIEPSDNCQVGWWDIIQKEFHKIGETTAFNWQQGSMLQWLPDSPDHIIFNTEKANRGHSKIVDLEGNLVRELPVSIYSLHPEGRFALGIQFEHLAYCREGYNYSSVFDPQWDKTINPEDGIFRIDLETGKKNKIISTEALTQSCALEHQKETHHWLEHMMWNHSGSRFAFFHRWSPQDSTGSKHITRLYTANADGSDLFCFPDSGFYSHMGWRDDKNFTIWGALSKQSTAVNRVPPVIRAILRPIYDQLSSALPGKVRESLLPTGGYIEFEDKKEEGHYLNEDLNTINGHNTWSKNRRYMLADTYQDKDSYRHLFIYDHHTQKIIPIGKFFSPFNDSYYRCDLHPRFNEDETAVIIDSAHQNNKHQMFIIDISKLLPEAGRHS